MRFTAILAAGLLAAPVHAADAPETTRAALIKALDTEAATALSARQKTVAAIATPDQARARQQMVKARIIALIGAPMHNVPLNARITGHIQGDGFRIENLMYDSQPGRHVTANLFLPVGKGPFPAVILSPGHGNNGKLSNYAFAANLAKNGIAALAYDIVGEGERMEYYDAMTGRSRGERATGDHSIAAWPAILTGEHVARHFVEDAMQGIDYLASRPEIDARRIGAFGCSGGGTVTAYVAALDDRVQAAATACYVNDFSHLLASVGPQDAEQSIPDFISGGLDVPDWVELAAPKPYAVISTTEDMFPFAGATAAVDEAKHFYAAFGAADKLDWFTGPGPHGAIAPMGDKIVDFFRRALKATAPAVPFAPLKPAREEDLMVTPTGQLVTSVGTKTLADVETTRLKTITPAQAPGAASVRAAIRKLARVTATPGAPVTATSSDVAQGDLTVTTVTFPSAYGAIEMRVTHATGKPSEKVLLLLDATPAKPGNRTAQMVAAGWTVATLQMRGADGTEDIKNALVGDENLLSLRALMVGHTLPGLRIDDTIHAMDWLSQAFKGTPVTIDGVGGMAPVALQAAALDERITAVRVENAALSWRDAVARPIARDLPVNAIPGVLEAYDLPDVIAAIGPRRVDVTAPVDPLDVPLRQGDFAALLHAANAHYSASLQP